jgi:hypothetical protein
MLGVGGHHKAAFAQAEQIVFSHQPLHPLAVHRPAAPL